MLNSHVKQLFTSIFKYGISCFLKRPEAVQDSDDRKGLGLLVSGYSPTSSSHQEDSIHLYAKLIVKPFFTLGIIQKKLTSTSQE